jgi:predicted HTH domain antitoxin
MFNKTIKFIKEAPIEELTEELKRRGIQFLSAKEASEAVKNVYKYLNDIDLMPYLIEYEGKELYELMQELAEIFLYRDQYSETLFDAVTEDEFTWYLNEKYGLNIQEEIISSYRVRL